MQEGGNEITEAFYVSAGPVKVVTYPTIIRAATNNTMSSVSVA